MTISIVKTMPRALFTASSAAALCVALSACAGNAPAAGGESQAPAAAPENTVTAVPLPEERTPVTLGQTVAAWQLANLDDLGYLPSHYEVTADTRAWLQAAFYIGLDHFAEATDDEALLAVVDAFSRDNAFTLGERVWHGDDQAVAAIYAKTAMRAGDASLVEPVTAEFDAILADPPTTSLSFMEPAAAGMEGGCQRRWCWADALFMAPPAWSTMTSVTGDAKYRDYALSEVAEMEAYLYDEEERLFYRDDRYFDQRTENGGKVFWSRGNGWVFAGLARLIETVPADDPRRGPLIALFYDMADGLVDRQRADGYWPTSLDDPALFLNPETSGTGFFGYGLAWGLNNGVLEGERYETATQEAWDAMAAAVQPDGRLGWVQQVGAAPEATIASSTQVYGSGAFLLFAAEMNGRE